MQGSIKLGIIAFSFPFECLPIDKPGPLYYGHLVLPLIQSLQHWQDREAVLIKLLTKKDKEIDDLREMLDERGHKLKKSEFDLMILVSHSSEHACDGRTNGRL